MKNQQTKCTLFVTSSEPITAINQSISEVKECYGEEFSINLFCSNELNRDKVLLENSLESVKESDFVFFYLHGTVTDFKGFQSILPLLENKKMFFHTGMEEEAKELTPKMHLYPTQYHTILRYYSNGNKENMTQMFLYIAKEVLGHGEYEVIEPTIPKWHGIYDNGERVENEEEYLDKVYHAESPKIGILIHWHSFMQKDLEHVDALIAKVRELGAVPVPVYSQIVPDEEMKFGGVEDTFHRYFMHDTEVVIDALINLTPFSVTVLATPGDGTKAQEHSIFEQLNIPVFQVMVSNYNYEEWESGPAGIHPHALAMHVFQPEFDGQLITFPVAYTKKIMTADGVKSVAKPIPERIDKVCQLIYNWANLKYVKSEDKKIAIIFHNIPPRNDTIGCAAGLDSPESVYHMVNALKEDGISMEYDFKDGQEIIWNIINGVTNDGRWSGEDELLEKSVDLVSAKQYRAWHDQFHQNVQKKMEKDWGTPPGTYMAIDDKILIPGIVNGNVFIGLQPPRALMEKAEELIHATDIVCPHQYLAFYHWIEHVFGANAVVHVGTHGTLEWLPGKDIGLSNACFPDVAIGTLPNLYPYVISNPGEGVQAKRRSYCGILDHMIPASVESGTYDELTILDELLREYYHFMIVDKTKVSDIAKRIWEVAVENEIHKDVDLTEEDAMKDIHQCIDKIHGWVSTIQSHEIGDGLHTYGQPPEGDQLRNMMKVLLRVKNGDMYSLRDALCMCAGYDLNELVENPTTLHGDGRTNAMVLEDLDEVGRQIFQRLQEANYQEKEIENIIENCLDFEAMDDYPLREVLRFTLRQVKPRLEGVTREITSFINGFQGKMIPTGLSGCPTRGNVHLLPTGRNFYTIDPGAIPTHIAWETGKRLAHQLLERYEKDSGEIPENITMLTYATDAMRTTGDDIGEILYLLGVKPVWLGNSERVIGMELISLEELGRPRLDVTLRITGLMRDTFPNLIEKIEDAVNLVASLEEPHDKNYVKKHVDEEMAELIQQGCEKELAFERASLRIFGDPPGTHGAGVKELVFAKKWNTVEDLGNVFTNWGCHAYGKKYHGQQFKEDFARRLSKTNVSVKNETTIETDMLASDDFYNYYGGLNAAITTHSGSQKPSYILNTANRDQIQMASLHEEASKIMRARVNNPKWIEGLKRHAYKGAQEVSSMVDIVFGWDATTSVIDDWMYQSIANRYMFDEENVEWMKEVNMFAVQNIAERLLEAVHRGMWDAPEEDVERLQEIYMEVEGDIEEIH